MWWGFTTHSRQQTSLIAGRFCCVGLIAFGGEYDAFIVVTFNLDIYEGNSIVVVDKQSWRFGPRPSTSTVGL